MEQYMSIKLIAVDLDGTITENSGQLVSKENLEAVYAAQKAGVFVTIATGRGCLASKTFWKQLHIEGPAIQFGGAWTIDTRTEQLLDANPLSPELVQQILEYAHTLGVAAQIYAGDTVVVEKTNPFSELYVTKNRLPYREDTNIRQCQYDNVPKVLAFVDIADEARVLQLFAERFEGRAHVTRSQPTFIEINACGVSKATALSRLAERMHIDRSEVAAIGDSFLDLDMIQWAGHGVCVADGVQIVQDAADIIVPACAENGVAYYIEHYVLDK
ncbi:MAG: Cof-type HAD-IIB family hydrolase [Clostridia bacterium]